MKKNKSYPEEFKREVLEMAGSQEVSIAQLERDLGITAGLIYKWLSAIVWMRPTAR